MLFPVASYGSIFMWHGVQVVMLWKCHIWNFFVHLRRCKDSNFFRDTIKMPRLSTHIYYIGIGACQPRGPNYTLRNGL